MAVLPSDPTETTIGTWHWIKHLKRRKLVPLRGTEETRTLGHSLRVHKGVSQIRSQNGKTTKKGPLASPGLQPKRTRSPKKHTTPIFTGGTQSTNVESEPTRAQALFGFPPNGIKRMDHLLKGTPLLSVLLTTKEGSARLRHMASMCLSPRTKQKTKHKPKKRAEPTGLLGPWSPKTEWTSRLAQRLEDPSDRTGALVAPQGCTAPARTSAPSRRSRRIRRIRGTAPRKGATVTRSI